MDLPRLYAITGAENVIERTKWLLRAGVRLVQYRDKTATNVAYAQTAQHLKTLCDAAGARLIINDRLAVAVGVGAWGLHLGQSDVHQLTDANRGLLAEHHVHVGISARSVAQAHAAVALGAHHLGVGAVWATNTKDSAPLGLQTLTKICQSTPLPVFAIGGVTVQNAGMALNAGAHGVAVVSAIWKESAETTHHAVHSFLTSFAQLTNTP